MHVSRTANLLGATTLAVNDIGTTGAARSLHLSTSSAAALVTLCDDEDVGVTEIGRRVGLSQPATSRLIDGLVRDGLVARRPAGGRSVEVRITAAGRRAAQRLLAAREASLVDLLDGLDEGEQEHLAALLSKILGRVHGAFGSRDLICRLCDRAACTTEAVCPVGEAERQQAGDPDR